MKIFKRMSLAILAIFYIMAGINHFFKPQGYIKIIPHWLPYPVVLNIMAGVAEVISGLLISFKRTRAVGAWLIVVMLIAFLPVHIDMLVQAPLEVGNIRVTAFIAWLRLLFQPVLIFWAWWHTSDDDGLC